MDSAAQRKVPMQVLVLSPPRTGTTSMKLALEDLLQAPVWHGSLMLSEALKPAKFWLDAIEAKYEGKDTPYTRSDFEVGLSKYAALSDQPCCWLWRELMDAYPEAKVILVQRDFESWIKSYDQASVTGGAFTPMTDVVVLLEPLLNSYVARAVRKVILGYFHARNAQDVLANARGVFERHYEDIREKCAETPGRLLEMRIDEGWQPICGFLNKEVPKTPFPRTNEIEALHAKSNEFRRRQVRKGVTSALAYLAVPVAIGVAVVSGTSSVSGGAHCTAIFGTLAHQK